MRSSRGEMRRGDPVAHVDVRNGYASLRAGLAMTAFVASVAVLGTIPSLAAERAAWPAKPLRLLVPFTPGGSQDVTARLLSAPVQQSMGQNIVVDNRPGSGGLIATQEGARATPD